MQRLGELADEQTPLLADLQRGGARPRGVRRAARPVRGGLAARAALARRRRRGRHARVQARHRGGRRAEGRWPPRASRPAPRPTSRASRGRCASSSRRWTIASARSRTDSRAQVNGPPPSDPSYNGGQGGFTGLEAIWNYPFWQGLSINGFDSVGHILRDRRPGLAGLLALRERQRRRTSRRRRSTPATPGSAPTSRASTRRIPRRRARPRCARRPASRPRELGERRGAGQPEAGPLPGQGDASQPQVTLPPQVEELLDRLAPGQRRPRAARRRPAPGPRRRRSRTAAAPALRGRARPGRPDQLLDFLLAP